MHRLAVVSGVSANCQEERNTRTPPIIEYYWCIGDCFYLNLYTIMFTPTLQNEDSFDRTLDWFIHKFYLATI